MKSFPALRSAAIAPALALTALLLGCDAVPPPGGPAGEGEVAAEVGGRTLTTAELDQRIKDDLFRRAAETPSELYELRTRALQRFVEERALAAEAERRGVEEGEVLAALVADLEPVTDEDARAFFEEHRAEMPGVEYDVVSRQVRGFLEARRLAEARSRLRDGIEVVVHLAPPRIDVSPDGAARGPADARVTIVEFSDFQCPFCKEALPALERVLEAYPDDVRLVYRHLPLDHIHPRARPAAEAAECARDQDRFWEFHDLVFANPRALEREDLVGYAERVGLDVGAFESCLDERRFAEKVADDEAEALETGISGTPAFVVNGRLLRGAPSFEELTEVIEEELARAGGRPADG